ncbi:nickel/cobalt transporter [Desulfovibrio sp. JC010]|uniref:nickel/cobalt transporter n=1 Tax=Desulfovibrio sp. JC010 TaxID=2593641 RepID=UPI0013D06809|nr:nickel ABC transporter permease [Desulfovibrio sp. JC010]NDV26073.1 nickel ABC transporter permease [Desulfovibrio sp. JC010]
MKNTNILIILILTITFAFSAVTAKAQQNNPFLAPQKQETQPQSPERQVPKSPFGTAAPAPSPATQTIQKDWTGGIYSKAMFKITLLQKEIRAKLTGFAREIKINPYGKSLWMFLGFAFIYGIVHAVGPGHGKSVVCAYFISRGGSMFAASFMSWVITLVHVGSATIAVCLAYLFLKSGMSGFEIFNRHLQTASYALVALIGLWLLIEALRSFNKNDRAECENRGRGSLKEIATVAFVTGIVPCPGAAIILVYTLSTGILPAGLAAMVFLATGMAVTTTCFALVAAKARNVMDRSSFTRSVRIAYSIISLIGAAVIICFGLLMLSAHLSLV